MSWSRSQRPKGIPGNPRQLQTQSQRTRRAVAGDREIGNRTLAGLRFAYQWRAGLGYGGTTLGLVEDHPWGKLTNQLEGDTYDTNKSGSQLGHQFSESGVVVERCHVRSTL